ncbi:glutaredoxin 2 [Rhinophrynus dorsalis]
MQWLLTFYSTVCRKVKSLELKEDTLLHLSTRFTASIAKRMGNSSTSISKPEAIKMVKEAISENCVVIFSKTTCPYCTMAKEAFDKINVSYKTVELDKIEHGNQLQAVLHKMTGARTVPRVFINGRCIGGGTETKNLGDEGKLLHLVQQCNISAETS